LGNALVTLVEIRGGAVRRAHSALRWRFVVTAVIVAMSPGCCTEAAVAAEAISISPVSSPTLMKNMDDQLSERAAIKVDKAAVA
jgi:hypothetical protein